jgi:hypothetical protein
LKKAVSILLVFLLLFNALGFYGLLRGLQYKTALDLVRRLDSQQYSKDETITIKVPFAIPYQLDSNGYERVDGEIQYDGEFYRLVEQKLLGEHFFVQFQQENVLSATKNRIRPNISRLRNGRLSKAVNE